MAGEAWFSSDHGNGLGPVLKDSWVKAFVDAEEYYADLRAEVESTTSGGQICWMGFDAGADTPMPVAAPTQFRKPFAPRTPAADDALWFDVLSAASDARNVPIRALLNLHPAPRPPDKYKSANFACAEKLNSLKSCAAINDFRYLFMNGTHHQKLVLVYNRKGLMAYCGTCDVERSRIEERWCELQLKVMGEAAAELYCVFLQRWSEHAEAVAALGAHKAYLLPLSSLRTAAPTGSRFLVQVSTTYGNPERANPFRELAQPSETPRTQVVNQAHKLSWGLGSLSYSLGNDFFTEKESAAPELLRQARAQRPGYGFAPRGHMGIYRQLVQAIEATRQFIYLEDQYLVCDRPIGKHRSICEVLVEKLKEESFQKLIIFCTRIDEINRELQHCGWAHRRSFIDALVAAAPDKVVICQYQRRAAVGAPGEDWRGLFYIHSKTWILDDELLVTGSANCNRRGYSHDSELNLALYDSDRSFVRELRIQLWKRRLHTEGMTGRPLQDADLADFLAAARYWENPEQWGLAIENNRTASLAPQRHPDLSLASYKAQLAVEPGADPVLLGALDRLEPEGLWDLVVDPEGS